MTPSSVVAHFCEDIREEINGLVTLVGVLPDNMQGQIDPRMSNDGVPAIPKLCIYARLNFDPNDDLGPIEAELIFPNNEITKLDLFGAAITEKAKREAIEKNSPIAGMISKVQMANFPLYAEGRLELRVTIKETTYIAASMHLSIVKSTLPTA